MKFLSSISLLLALTFSTSLLNGFAPAAGFSLPDSIREVTITYKRAFNLVVLPVIINDTIRLNLILDTGCSNLVLFGKRFTKMFTIHPTRGIEFSGLGSGKAVTGRMSIDNKVAIGAVQGHRIPIVIVENQKLFGSHMGVDGIIGYDVFIKFEIELIPSNQSITFRPAFTSDLACDYTRIPIRVEGSRAFIDASVSFSSRQKETLNLMIDTGSSLGLLLKTNDRSRYRAYTRRQTLGRGLNGALEGSYIATETLILDSIELKGLDAGVIESPWPTQASLGMGVLEGYALVLNYCKGYAGLKPDPGAPERVAKSSQKPPKSRVF
jgi:hypothetical protein